MLHLLTFAFSNVPDTINRYMYMYTHELGQAKRGLMAFPT